MNEPAIIIPDIPLIPPLPNATETASPIPFIVTIIRVIHQAHFWPFIKPYTVYSMIKPSVSKKYPKIIPVDVFLNPVGKEFFNVHMTSKGVPGKIVDIPTIKAKIAAIKKIMATIRTPFGLFSILITAPRDFWFFLHQAFCNYIR